MGAFYSTNTHFEDPRLPINRFPIISPRHVPNGMSYKNTPYSKFDPKLYQENFKFQIKALPKYT